MPTKPHPVLLRDRVASSESRTAAACLLRDAGAHIDCPARGNFRLVYGGFVTALSPPMQYFSTHALLRLKEQHGGSSMKAFISGTVALAALVASGTATLAQNAMRAGAPPPEIPPAPYNWNGLYFGASIGLARGQSTQTAITGDLTPSFDLTGGVFGLALGYNWQAGPVLYGVDTDISLSTNRGTSGYLGAPAGFLAETAEEWIATYRGRLGLVHESWMFYVTGGGATADVKIIATEPGAGIASESKTRWGWAAGVGVEAARIHSFTVKAEYIYADFGSTAYFNPPPPLFINRAGGVRLYDHILRIGLNHKFTGI
jgi:opacity protein-like surface antigen